MLRKQDENVMGKMLPFREYTFLQNPRMGKATLASRVEVEVCDAGEADAACATAASPPKARAKSFKLAQGLKDADLAKIFEPFQKVKIISLNSIGTDGGVFGGWSDPMVQSRFYKRATSMTGIWCCVNAHPGHIWYDMLWDMVPRPIPDRHNRKRDGPWDYNVKGP